MKKKKMSSFYTNCTVCKKRISKKNSYSFYPSIWEEEDYCVNCFSKECLELDDHDILSED